MTAIPFSVERRSLECRFAVTLADARKSNHPLVLVNPAYCELVGFKTHELLGRHRDFWWGERHQTAPLELEWNNREKGQRAIFETISGNGEHFQKLTFAYILHDARKQPTLLLATHFPLPTSRLETEDASEFRKLAWLATTETPKKSNG